MGNYNDNAAALTWEIINNSEDIGKWKLVYLSGKDIKEFEGKGFKEFLNAANNLSESVNVIYVKRMRWFVHLAKGFIDFKDKDFFASYSTKKKFRFFYAVLTDKIQIRDWDSFWSKVDDATEFLNRLDKCRQIFIPENQKSKKGLEKGYKTTLSHDMWEDIRFRYHLYQPWCYNYCKTMAPQDEDELAAMESLDKGGFYYQNPNFLNKVIVKSVHQFDISSAFLSYLATEKFPLTSFTLETDDDKIQKIIKDKFYCWHGEFHFTNLRYRNELFKIDLSRFGQPVEHEYNSWFISLTNVDIEWFKNCFEWDDCLCNYLYYAQQRPFTFDLKDYAKMFHDLYDIKEAYSKGSFAKEISKFRAQLCFGQPIKQVDYPSEVYYDEEINDFQEREKEVKKTFSEIVSDFCKRGIPMYVGLWVAAYARKEFFMVLYKIGFENVIYGDTDSVKFIGKEGIKIIEEHNKENKNRLREINKKRNLLGYNDKIGQWIDEGDLSAFKAIGTKWYVTIDMKGELDVKASGADVEVLKKWLNEQRMPLQAFDYSMEVFGLFHEIKIGNNGKGIVFRYKNKMDKDIKKDILRQGTELYDFVPFKED